MGPMLRLNETESERMNDLSLELNKLMIDKGIQPLAMSKLLHLAIQVGMDKLEDEPEVILAGSNKDYRKLGIKMLDHVFLRVLPSNRLLCAW